MLTPDECRKRLGAQSDGLTDAEIASYRDQFYQLAELCCDICSEAEEADTSKIFDDSEISEEEREMIHERAAIHEIDAGLPQWYALRLALSRSSGSVN